MHPLYGVLRSTKQLATDTISMLIVVQYHNTANAQKELI
jgi:hypothetical protein